MSDPSGGRPLLRGLLRLCLLAWPARLRRRDGPPLIETAMAVVSEARKRGRLVGLGEAAAETIALVRAGFGLRLAAMRREALGTARAAITGLMGDLRFALRVLRRSPGFTAVAIVMLAVGIGVNTTMFSLVDAVLLSPPPYERPEELVFVWNSLPGSDERIAVAGPDAAILAERASRLDPVAFMTRGLDGAVEIRTGNTAHPARLAAVTPGFFDVLGVQAALGRTLGPIDAPDARPRDGEQEASSTAVLLSHGAWRRIFSGNPGVVGRAVHVNGREARVVGVMPSGFSLVAPPDAGLAADVDLWLPLSVPLEALHREPERLLDQDSDNTGVVVARLATDATLAQARQEAGSIAADLQREMPAYAAAGMGFSVRPLHADATAHARPILLALLAGATGVLLVAALNIATLLIARGTTRTRELSVRACLGAGRARLVRQLVVEAGVLTGAGLAAAAGVAYVTLLLLVRLLPTDLATAATGIVLDTRALLVGAAVAGGVLVLFTVIPSLRAITDRGTSGIGPGSVRGRTRSRVRQALVSGQVALSVVLVLAAGLLVRTVGALQDVRPGFEPDGALSFSISLTVPGSYRGPAERAAFVHQLETGLSTLPGVRAVGLVAGLPLSGERWTQPYGLPGQTENAWRENRADFRAVTSGSFDALGTRLLEGRTFTPREDLQEDERVIVVDEKLAARLAPGGSAIDAVIGIPLDGRAVEARVVGVVGHVRYERLDADGREAIYVPYRQEASRGVSFVIRSGGDPASLAPAVRDVVRDLDPRVPVRDVETLRAYVDRQIAPRRLALGLLAGFSALGLLCAAVGLYGVVAHEVARRTRDIGVRMAVGADRGTVVRSVLASGARLTAVGLLAGALLGALSIRAIRGLVFGVAVSDPVTWGTVLTLVAGITLMASWLPARRAARLSPTEALRSD